MPKAGLFSGVVTESAPAADAATVKQKGYQWMEYGNVVPPFAPESYNYSSTVGHCSTQHSFYGGATADFTHPFQGESYAEFFMSAVFQNTSAPLQTDPRGLLNLYNGVQGTQFYVQARPGPQYFWGFAFSGLGAGTPRRIVSNDFEVTLDYSGWLWGDWYFMALSYSQSLNKATAAIVNFTRSAEDSFAPAVSNNDNVIWEPASDGTAKSQVMYGYGEPAVAGGVPPTSPDLAFQGNMSQIMVHNSYVDLEQAVNRRKFCALDGVLDLGYYGENPFGVQPLIYMPSGHPSDNRGTVDIGNYPPTTDFFVKEPLVTGTTTPPEGTP